MAPSRPVATNPPSFTQTTLNGSLIRRDSPSITSVPGNKHRISKKSPKAQCRAPQKLAVSGASDRVSTDVLLSIKPVHLANIVTREKNHEYRKYRLRDGVIRLWLYETSDRGGGRASITHVAVVPASVRHTPGSVPSEPFGIGNAEFNTGLKQSKYGYPLLELYELVCPVTLAEMKSQWGMGGAPMGWRYLRRDLWRDRWGEDEGRATKVTRVF